MADAIKQTDWSSAIGRKLGTVTLINLLGQGAMGCVFVGYQHTLKRQVAVKLLPRKSTQAVNTDLFRNEAEMVAVLSHPNIIPIYEMGETDDLYYQIMQLIQGRDLKAAIVQRHIHPLPNKRTFPLDQTLQIMIQILDGLGYAHDEGVIHHDIKPANILIEERAKRPLIADFGIAKAAAQADTIISGDLMIGTPRYMAPEQARCEATDGRADMYAAGIVLIEMITGTQLLKDEAPEKVVQRKRFEPESIDALIRSILPPALGPALTETICRATASNCNNRYIHCSQFKAELQRALTMILSGNHA